ncbi:MAG: hypothetical protein QG594_1501 [Bacteroidota bacterium]|nr:hypothetical protein [Bacteroidota bacterium]
MNVKPKKCKICGLKFTPIRSTTERVCNQYGCKVTAAMQIVEKQNKSEPKKRFDKIPNVSKKRKIENLQYQVLRAEFLNKTENKICFIDGCSKPSTTIEHRGGRWGKNYLDTSTWAGCCLEHNLELENNSELSKKYQLSKITGKPKE